jgi:Cthe_2314-like HEPN
MARRKVSKLQNLVDHSFAIDVLTKGISVEKLLGNRSPSRVVPNYARDPDEHEYFLIGVAISMAEVLSLCQQLDQIPVFLGSHHQTSAMDRANINRHSLIVYHLENYVIRTQSLLDRVLKLVDSVFHLTNDPKNCRYEVVVRNVKVQISDAHEPLKKLKKLLERYTGARNEIVHHHSIKEDALRRLDMYFLSARWSQVAPREKQTDFKGLIRDTIFEILWFKKKELNAYSDEMAAAIVLLFDKLRPYYAREESALRLRLSKPNI